MYANVGTAADAAADTVRADTVRADTVGADTTDDETEPEMTEDELYLLHSLFTILSDVLSKPKLTTEDKTTICDAIGSAMDVPDDFVNEISYKTLKAVKSMPSLARLRNNSEKVLTFFNKAIVHAYQKVYCLDFDTTPS